MDSEPLFLGEEECNLLSRSVEHPRTSCVFWGMMLVVRIVVYSRSFHDFEILTFYINIIAMHHIPRVRSIHSLLGCTIYHSTTHANILYTCPIWKSFLLCVRREQAFIYFCNSLWEAAGHFHFVDGMMIVKIQFCVIKEISGELKVG